MADDEAGGASAEGDDTANEDSDTVKEPPPVSPRGGEEYWGSIWPEGPDIAPTAKQQASNVAALQKWGYPEHMDPDARMSSNASGYAPAESWMRAEDPVKDGDIAWGPFNGGINNSLVPGFSISKMLDMTSGPRWSVRRAVQQLWEAIFIDAAIFIVNEAITAYYMLYWRPIAWSLVWIAVTVLVSGIGLAACHYRSEFGLIGFTVLQLMFSAINLQHLNMSHSEAVKGCATRQAHYKHCEVPALYHCIYSNDCSTVDMAAQSPPCHAMGKAECDQFAAADSMFWVNQVINFLTYAEPAFWATMAVIRMEIVNQEEGEGRSEVSRGKGTIDGRTTAFSRLHSFKVTEKEPADAQPFNKIGAGLILVAWLAICISSVVDEMSAELM